MSKPCLIRNAVVTCCAAWLFAALLAVAGIAAADPPLATDPVHRLEQAYGPPSQSGFGSAVFRDALPPDAGLAAAALATYRRFVGPNWDRFGEQAWLSAWREVHARAAGSPRNIVAELQAITDADARRSVSLLLEAPEDAVAARAALSAAFDDAAVTELKVFTVGDGEAMSGLLVAARRAQTRDAICVIVLMD